MSKVSCRSASTINALAKKGDQYVSALIEIAEEIRKGAGSRKIENLVNTIVNGEKKIDDQRQIVSKDGNVIGKWVKNTLVFDQSFKVNQKDIEDLLTAYL